MHFLSKTVLASLIIIAAGPAIAAATPAAKPASTQSERIAMLEAQLQRQILIADNARREVETMRGEMQLKDELLELGRQRNAELYAIASEVIDRFVRSRSLEPFAQASRVKMENLKQSYEDRLRAARVHEATLPPSLQRRMDTELNAAATPGAPPTPQN